MLDYIFRRDSKTISSDDTSALNNDAQKSVQDESAKQAALLEADSLAGDEAGAVRFILQCRFADARLRAAEHVHGRPMLEQVLHSVRKLDRRVAKLVQSRIDEIAKHEMITKLAQDCIDEARRLMQEVPLVSNLVADLDRNWRSIGEVGEPHRSTYDSLRNNIDARLAAQTALQRAVIDALDAVRKLNAEADKFSSAEWTEHLALHDQQAAQYRSSPEASSLPKNLLAEFDLECLRLKERQAIHEQHFSDDSSRKEERAVREAIQPKKQEANSQAYLDVLEAMEHALQEGVLQLAAEQDEVLRTMDLQSQRVNNSHATRLSTARAELKRLQGWARWGGNVSREELIKAVEDLSVQKISVQELTIKLGSLRDRWKSLDAASGAAPKALWDRFDTACKVAYAPIVEKTRNQAQERQKNREKAQALFAELLRFIDSSGLEKQDSEAPATDWKLVANFQRSTLQSWQRIGHMDRKDKKRLDAEFDRAMQALMIPLQRQWQIEIERRESMIREVEQININDRKAIDRVRMLQERWQQIAKALPLERQDDQALWQRFRSACNAVFAQRKEAVSAADAQRRQHAASKLALCVALEAALDESEPAIRKLLRETDTAWAQIGPVPRAREQLIEERYRKGVAVLRARLESAKSAAIEAQGAALFEKFSLCTAVEAAVVAGLPFDPGWTAHWLMLPPLQGARERLMGARFDAAIHAFSGGGEYAAVLKKNRDILQQELLHLEIISGLSSPPEFSRMRMQMQIEVLQSSLSGQKVDSFGARIDKLCGLPSLVDQQSLERIHLLFKKALQL